MKTLTGVFLAGSILFLIGSGCGGRPRVFVRLLAGSGDSDLRDVSKPLLVDENDALSPSGNQGGRGEPNATVTAAEPAPHLSLRSPAM